MIRYLVLGYLAEASDRRIDYYYEILVNSPEH